MGHGICAPPAHVVLYQHLKRCFEMSKPLLDITRDIHSLTTFRRRSGDFMKQLKKSKRPVVLTVKGKAAAIVQDAEAYQRLLDIAAQADAEEGIRQGLEDVARGRTRPARRAFDEVRRRHDVPR
jgi:prevent-host-death family protein